MRAIELREFGPPDRLVVVDLPNPVPGAGQALVAVEFASITFVETQVRAGRPPNPAMAPGLPVVLGNGVGGTVAAVGEGVDPGLVGRQVITTTGGSGGYAQLVAVDAALLIDVLSDVDLADAVALLADGRTAMALMRAAEVRGGETVLVEAAAGGVGSLLVQLARNASARVVAAAGGSQSKRDLARELGAAVFVDYTQPDWVAQVRTAVDGVDVVFDSVGGAIGLAAFDLVRRGGRFLSFGLASGAFTAIPADVPAARGVSVIRGAPVEPAEMRALTRAALAERQAGRLSPVIGQRFPLEQAAEAHAAMEARATLGKTLLVVAPPG